jgi:hypothetical protein
MPLRGRAVLKATDRYAHEMDAAAYWRSFPTNVRFTEPTEIIGVVVNLGAQHSADGPIPRLKIQQADGSVVVILVTWARLLDALVEKVPVVGDRIKIEYLGPAKQAAPGMRPAKEFKVAVQRARAEVRTVPEVGTSGPENVPQPGDAS